MRLFRLLRLLDHFRTRTTPVTARELAPLMEVSIRSLYRDIADLQAMGAPIRGEGGVGYVMERGYFLPSLRFDDEELHALALGLRLAGERSSDQLADAARRATAKIAAAVGDGGREPLLAAPLAAGPSAAADAARTSPAFDDIRRAIGRRAELRIDYLSLAGTRSSRLARPLGLTAFDGCWLLTIWCELAQDFRHLRLDRIEAYAQTGRRFRDERGKRFADVLSLEQAKRAGRDGAMRPAGSASTSRPPPAAQLRLAPP